MGRHWSVDSRPQLQGRGLTEYVRLPKLKGPMHLWNHVHQPPVQNSVVVWKDGTCTEGIEFGPEVFGSPDLHFVVQGGHQYFCADLDQFTRDSLMAAGYSCTSGILDIYARDDRYTDDYPEVNP